MGKAPDMPDQKTPQSPVNVAPLQARNAQTQQLPRQTMMTQREPIGPALANMGQSERRDPRIAMELLRRGSY